MTVLKHELNASIFDADSGSRSVHRDNTAPISNHSFHADKPAAPAVTSA
jgi:hypothetical protein